MDGQQINLHRDQSITFQSLNIIRKRLSIQKLPLLKSPAEILNSLKQQSTALPLGQVRHVVPGSSKPPKSPTHANYRDPYPDREHHLQITLPRRQTSTRSKSKVILSHAESSFPLHIRIHPHLQTPHNLQPPRPNTCTMFPHPRHPQTIRPHPRRPNAQHTNHSYPTMSPLVLQSIPFIPTNHDPTHACNSHAGTPNPSYLHAL